jgi:hypothetical protein
VTTYWQDDLGFMHEVKPGSFGLSRIGGLLGKLIAAGQAFSGDGSRFTHAFVVLDQGEVIEAMPGRRGARIVPIADRLAHDEVVFCDAPVRGWLAEHSASRYSEQVLREIVVGHARTLEGAPYGYLQYLALGLAALGLAGKPGEELRWWFARKLRAYIADSGRMICSQLVDEVYHRAGIRLFEDGRLPQDVTPGDLDDYRVRALQRQVTR